MHNQVYIFYLQFSIRSIKLPISSHCATAADTSVAVLAALCVCGTHSLAADVDDFVALIYFKLVFTAYAGSVCDK